jgi:hypothetical protein
MRNVLLLTTAILAFAARPAAADDVWSCSVVQEGKPQVLKIRVGKITASSSNWITRLANEFGGDMNHDLALLPISNTKDALVLVSQVRIEKEAGHLSEVSLDTIAINRRTGELTITTVSTLNKPEEIKGKCTL